MILGFIEQEQGALPTATTEMLTFGRELAAAAGRPLAGVIFGAEDEALAEQAAAYGVSHLFFVDVGSANAHPRLHAYAPAAWARAIQQVVASETAQALGTTGAVLAAGTDRGHEVLAHLAAQAGLPLAANCTAVAPGDTYAVTRMRWGGSLLEEAELSGEPKLLTVALHVVAPATVQAAAAASVTVVTPELEESDFRVQLKERLSTAGDQVSLTDARVVVGGGRGVGSSEGFAPLEELAGLLEGAVGASRAVTNHGWRSHADQIGQTGARIAPDLYIACGISGAVQHMVGCRGAKKILAINTDPEAAIIAKADYAIIGDLHEVVPALCLALKEE